WMEVWEGLVRLSGPIVPWIAIAALVIIVADASLRPKAGFPRPAGRRLHAIVIALLGCAILPWAAYYQGHPIRIRYDVPLVAAAPALIGAAVALLPRAARAVAGVAIVAIAIWQAPPFDRSAPVIVEAQRVAAEDAGRAAVTAYLTAHWDGRPIMMSM